MELNPLSTGFVVNVEPNRGYVKAGETVTFYCDANTTEPIHHFSWNISPPMSETRYTYDNNDKTIHIRGMNPSENNTQVTCIATADRGVNMSATAFISLLEFNDEDGDDGGGDDGGGDDGGDDGERPMPRPRRTTPKVKITSTSANDVLTRKPTARTSYPPTSPKSSTLTNEPGRTHARITRPDEHGMPEQFNPAIIATLIAIGALILIAIIVVVVKRLRRKTGSNKSSRSRSGMHVSNRSYHGGYEVAPIVPIAATIDSRHSQSPDIAPPGHSRHYNQRYQKPIHNKGKNHKSLPSLYTTSAVDEYEYMEPGEQGRMSTNSAPFGQGYDHLSRSNPEAIHQLGLPTFSGIPANYASLSKVSKDNANVSYENQHVPGSPAFELNERLKYASLNHQDDPMSPTSSHPPKRKTSYAKIRGILRILRTQNSTRVNIEPC